MRGLDLDELLICSCSLVSIRLINRKSGRRMVDELLELSGWRSGQQERASGLAKRWPRMWMILKLMSVRASNHWA